MFIEKCQKNKGYTLEVCVDSVESALAAERGGASRLELCNNLIIGGTTPTESLYIELKKYCSLPVHILIRPRFGDFCYTSHEFEIMREDIRRFSKLGTDGVVIGMLKTNGSLDVPRLQKLMEDAGEMSVTLHRAFDVCQNPFDALEQAISLGFTSILTSGQKNSCVEGIPLLEQLQKQAAGRIQILAGAGINSEVIETIYQKTGITNFHMSGKKILDSAMVYRKDGVSMGIPAFSEYEIFQTDEEEVRKAKTVLEQLIKIYLHGFP